VGRWLLLFARRIMSAAALMEFVTTPGVVEWGAPLLPPRVLYRPPSSNSPDLTLTGLVLALARGLWSAIVLQLQRVEVLHDVTVVQCCCSCSAMLLECCRVVVAVCCRGVAAVCCRGVAAVCCRGVATVLLQLHDVGAVQEHGVPIGLAHLPPTDQLATNVQTHTPPHARPCARHP